MTKQMLTQFVLTGLFLLPVSLTAQSMESIDSKQIFDNADFILAFQVEKLESHLDEETREHLKTTHEWLQETLGLETALCKEVILQFGAEEYPDSGRGLGETVGIVFRAEDDIPVEQITSMVDRFGLEEGSHNERTYYGETGPPLFYFHENSLIIGEKERIHELIDSEVESMGDRDVEILEKVSRDSDICVHVKFDNESFRKFFHLLFMEVDNLSDGEALTTIANHAESATLNVQLDGMHAITLVLEASESGDTEALLEATQEFVSGMKGFAAKMQRELTRGAPTTEITDSATRFSDSLTELLQHPQIDADDTSVTVTISESDVAQKTLNEFVNMMNAAADFFGGR